MGIVVVTKHSVTDDSETVEQETRSITVAGGTVREGPIITPMSVAEPPWPRGAGDGFPFRESVLVLKSVPSRMDDKLAFTIEDGMGRQVARGAPVSTSGVQGFAQFIGAGDGVSWEFMIARVDGPPLLSIRRPRIKGWSDRHQRFEVHNPGGVYIGRLLQNNSYLASFPNFTLEGVSAAVGTTTYDYKRIAGAFGQITAQTVTIRDNDDAPVAGIVQRRTGTRIFNNFYDYTLTFIRPPYEPMGSLCLAVVFSEFFRQRTKHGGALRAFRV